MVHVAQLGGVSFEPSSLQQTRHPLTEWGKYGGFARPYKPLFRIEGDLLARSTKHLRRYALHL